jgi:hypothetical protein
MAAESAGAPRSDPSSSYRIGREVSIPEHLRDDGEFHTPIADLLAFGKKIFTANWTEQERGGRPLAKGTDKALSDPPRL